MKYHDVFTSVCSQKMTDWVRLYGKIFDSWSFVQASLRLVCMASPWAKYFPVWPDLTQSIGTYYVLLFAIAILGKCNGWRENSTLNFTRKTISHELWSNESDIVFQVKFNVELRSHPLNFSWIPYLIWNYIFSCFIYTVKSKVCGLPVQRWVPC